MFRISPRANCAEQSTGRGLEWPVKECGERGPSRPAEDMQSCFREVPYTEQQLRTKLPSVTGCDQVKLLGAHVRYPTEGPENTSGWAGRELKILCQQMRKASKTREILAFAMNVTSRVFSS